MADTPTLADRIEAACPRCSGRRGWQLLDGEWEDCQHPQHALADEVRELAKKIRASALEEAAHCAAAWLADGSVLKDGRDALQEMFNRINRLKQHPECSWYIKTEEEIESLEQRIAALERENGALTRELTRMQGLE